MVARVHGVDLVRVRISVPRMCTPSCDGVTVIEKLETGEVIIELENEKIILNTRRIIEIFELLIF